MFWGSAVVAWAAALELVAESLWLVVSLVPFAACLLEAGVVVGEVEQLVEHLVEQLVVLLVGPWTAGASAWLR